MDGVVVGEKAVLQGCILGRRCVIGAGANLKECEVQEGYTVLDLTEGKAEKYMIFEGLDEDLEGEADADGNGDGKDGLLAEDDE